MTKKLTIAMLLLCVAAFGATQHVLFVDQSVSPPAADMERWSQAANSAVFAPLQFGDSVLVFGIHDHTADSAPIFDASIPTCGPYAGMDCVIQARRTLLQVRQNGLEAVRAALHSGVRSRTTKLIESLARIPHDPKHRVEVLFLSDMLESTRELDLERTSITDANVMRLVQSVVDRYRFRSGALNGVTVRAVLDSPPIGGRHVVANDHAALERFWRLLITGLGGNLASFDSRVQIGATK
jgi:hypothetical protein